jgi:hypothetical protein
MRVVRQRFNLIAGDAHLQRSFEGLYRYHQGFALILREQDSFDAVERSSMYPHAIADRQKRVRSPGNAV